MVTSYARGWEIYLKGDKWYYSDTNEEWKDDRPCKKCGKYPTKEGYDACLGFIKGTKSACCGHGVKESYIIKDN